MRLRRRRRTNKKKSKIKRSKMGWLLLDLVQCLFLLLFLSFRWTDWFFFYYLLLAQSIHSSDVHTYDAVLWHMHFDSRFSKLAIENDLVHWYSTDLCLAKVIYVCVCVLSIACQNIQTQTGFHMSFNRLLPFIGNFQPNSFSALVFMCVCACLCCWFLVCLEFVSVLKLATTRHKANTHTHKNVNGPIAAIID